jgi:hypothetical protein
MDPSQIHVRLSGNGGVFVPGGELSGTYAIEVESAQDLRAVEVSVLWYTEGKGESDLSVQWFLRHEASDVSFSLLTEPQQFRMRLPDGPLSYDGLIVKIKWCVRVRVFPAWGREVVVEEAFVLGNAACPVVEEV